MNWWQVGFWVLAVAYLGIFWLVWRVVRHGLDPEMNPDTEAALLRVITQMEHERKRFRYRIREPQSEPPPLENLQTGDVAGVWLDPRACGYIHGYLRMEPIGGDKDAWERVFAGQG